MTSNKNKNNFLVTVAAIVIIGGMAGFGYQFYEHNNRVVQEFRSIDIPDHEETVDNWIKYTGSNPCPGLVEQRFDANRSHYMCMFQR